MFWCTMGGGGGGEGGLIGPVWGLESSSQLGIGVVGQNE